MFHIFSDSSVVQAEPVQYALVNTQTALNCSTTLDAFDFLVDISWFRGEGADRMSLSGRPQFESTAISDEGVYTCVIDITEMGIATEKRINFKVIGKHIDLYKISLYFPDAIQTYAVLGMCISAV